MATQHGHLLKEQIKNGAVPFLADKLEFELKNDGPLKNHPILQRVVAAYVNYFVFRKLIKNIPSEYHRLTECVLKAAGVPTLAGLKAGAMPDAMSILSRVVGKHGFPYISPETFGCTSFATYGAMTPNGELMQGRNLDFPVSEYWDQSPLVIYHHPKSSQKYCSITTAGINIPGVTGFNESGLILAIHQLFTKNETANGVPIVIICSEVIKHAKCLDDAIRIFKSMKRAADWAVLISSVKEKRVIVVESSPKDVYVREAQDGLIAQSNYLFNPKNKPYEIFFNWTTAEDNFFRRERLMKRCLELKGNMNEKEGIQLLGDHFDGVQKQHRAIGRVVSTIYNVQSMFFRPELKKFWISTGKAPANLSPYIELPMDWDLSQKLNSVEHAVIEPNEFSRTEKCEAKRLYTKAYHYFSDLKDFETALSYVVKAVNLDSKEFAYSLAAGFLSLKIGDFIGARKFFEQCLKLNISLYEQALASLFLGRTWDLIDERKRAIQIYLQFVDHPQLDQKIKKAFQTNVSRKFKPRHIQKVIFQFIFADFLAY